MPRSRETPSPPYPVLGLREVVQRGRGLVPLIGKGAVSADVVYKALGFGSANGTSKNIVNTFRQYGLLIKEKQGLQVADDVRALHDERNTDSRRRALLRFGRGPEIFRTLAELFPRALDEDQSGAREYLRSNGYRPGAVDSVMSAYRSTQDLLAVEGAADTNGPALPTGDAQPSPPEAESAPRKAALETPRRRDHEAEDAQPAVGGNIRNPTNRRDSQGETLEKSLFSYRFENGGGVKLIVEGDASADDVLSVVRLWLDMKNYEIERRGKIS